MADIFLLFFLQQGLKHSCRLSTIISMTCWNKDIFVAPLHTDKKENKIFLILKETQNGAVAKLYMTNGLLRLNISAFPHIVGCPSSYMTLQPRASEFPYILGKFYFLFYQYIVNSLFGLRTFIDFKDLFFRSLDSRTACDGPDKEIYCTGKHRVDRVLNFSPVVRIRTPPSPLSQANVSPL
jgi:hypothetical protein